MSSDVTMLVLQWEMLFRLFNIWPFNWFQHGAVSPIVTRTVALLIAAYH